MVRAQALALVRNSFNAAYLPEHTRTAFLKELDEYASLSDSTAP